MFDSLPILDDLEFDISYVQMPLSLFCKILGVSENELMEFKNEHS